MRDGGRVVSKNEHNPAVPTAFGHRGHTGDKEAKDGCVRSELPRNTGTLATESCVWTVATPHSWTPIKGPVPLTAISTAWTPPQPSQEEEGPCGAGSDFLKGPYSWQMLLESQDGTGWGGVCVCVCMCVYVRVHGPGYEPRLLSEAGQPEEPSTSQGLSFLVPKTEAACLDHRFLPEVTEQGKHVRVHVRE